MPHDDFAVEPIPGLPERPPAGEEILWQGRPQPMSLARQALLVHWVAAYFGVLAIWRTLSVIDLMPFGQAIGAGVPFLILGLLAFGLLWLVAYVQARATLYTVTTARVVMRIGAALTLTLNIPYREISNAGLDLRKDGTGTIAFETTGRTRLSYLVCWPHVRPWAMNPTQPALRCIPDAVRVARIVAEAAETRIAEPRVVLQSVAAE